MSGKTKDSPERESYAAEISGRIRFAADKFNNRVEAAKAAGVSKSTLQTWIDASRSPSFEALARLAGKADVSLDWIATGVGGSADTPSELSQPIDRSTLKIDNSRIDKILSAFRELYHNLDEHIDKDAQPGTAQVIAMYNLTIEMEDGAELDRGINLAMKMHGDHIVELSEAAQAKALEAIKHLDSA